MLRKALALAAVFWLAAAAAEAATSALPPKDVHWSFEGPFGQFDQEQLQRGYKVYHDVCSACHSMNLMRYANLGQPGGPFYDPKYPNPIDNPYVKALAKGFQVTDIDQTTGDPTHRPATPADTFAPPFPNEYAARASNSGALPPDLSLIIKAREDGPEYVYSILTGYVAAPGGLAVSPNRFYNPYFPGDLTANWNGKGAVPPGGLIAMPLQLTANRVTYDDHVAATPDQEARDVTAFLAWASEPHQTDRKRLGFSVMIFLVIFSGLLYASYRRIWRNVAH
jgi:ubiquinol-cytochrome c reductase cytochrome c1 subunit